MSLEILLALLSIVITILLALLVKTRVSKNKINIKMKNSKAEIKDIVGGDKVK
ncbi:MAG: hypothetical protein GX654_19030 [Desulfatiglans sp.]|nr:hypothetical protein [Desulfatiglans sp.]